MHFTLENNSLIEFPENRSGDLYAAQNTILFREDDSERLLVTTYDRIGSDIASTDILF